MIHFIPRFITIEFVAAFALVSNPIAGHFNTDSGLGTDISRTGVLAADASGAVPPPPEQRERGRRPRGRVYKALIHPHWCADNLHFWYRNDLPGGAREYILIDARRGIRRPAFDHDQLAAALVKIGIDSARPDRLPIAQLQFDLAANRLIFRAEDRDWQWDLDQYTIEPYDGKRATSDDHRAGLAPANLPRASLRTGPETALTFINRTAYLKDTNIYLRSKDNGEVIQLSHDGGPDNAYGMLQWAPDGHTLIAYRIEPGDHHQVHLIESSPPNGGRAILHSRPYPLPGDKFPSHELNLFDIRTRKQQKPDVDPIDFGQPHLRWNDDGYHFTYQQVDRGHQRFRLIEIDSHTGSARHIIDESSATFIWTAHTENLQLKRVNWLPQSNRIVYVSERDGWRHLYLVDVATGTMRQITKGPYVIRAIDEIDEEKGQIWFRASGKHPDQDPYFLHYYRVQLDGTGLVELTAGNGSHRIQYSPDRNFLLDTYSRVDQAPIHELRRVADGSLVCQFERADIGELEASGWKPPEVFVAKARDGTTDIWGIICRPHDFDPRKKYPIIEDIYAGPQSAYVPKTFSGSPRYAALTELGFIVVKIDGMGTAHRSKAFHDVCWKNLKDAGFPDRIRWIQAAAAQDPALDTTRVGIYGNSAGGQNAAGAVLFHPEFYRVAVASCGCHDNRLDKASWNEQWMGFPVGPHYAASSNIEHADRLQGHLMLIVGEMDMNVPPENTMRLVDALIKADKNFSLLVIPGGGHGMGGSYGARRMREFFVRHLLGKRVGY